MDNERNNTPEEIEDDFAGDLIELTDEEGNAHSFELVDTLEKDGTTYVALITNDEEDLVDGDASLIIMRVVSEDGEDEVLEMLDDEDVFNEISEIFMDRLADLYEFDDDDDDCCCCGHNHENEHDCECGHEHDHDCGCGCGCEHN